MSSKKDNKYGKKKMFKIFDREKKYIYCEEDIIIVNKNQNLYKEERNNERHLRKATTPLDTEQNYNHEIDNTIEKYKTQEDNLILDDDSLSE